MRPSWFSFTNWGLSISTDWLSDSSHSISITCYDLDIVTSVDVSLSDRIDDVLSRALNILLAFRQDLDLEVVANELVVKNRCSKLRAWALHAIRNRVVGPNCIVAIHDTFATFIDTTEQVKGVVRHEAATVKCHRELLGDALGWRRSLVLHLILTNHELEVLVEGFDIGDHTSWSQDGIISELSCLGLSSGEDIVACRHPCIRGHCHEISSRNRWKWKLG